MAHYRRPGAEHDKLIAWYWEQRWAPPILGLCYMFSELGDAAMLLIVCYGFSQS